MFFFDLFLPTVGGEHGVEEGPWHPRPPCALVQDRGPRVVPFQRRCPYGVVVAPYAARRCTYGVCMRCQCGRSVQVDEYSSTTRHLVWLIGRTQTARMAAFSNPDRTCPWHVFACFRDYLFHARGRFAGGGTGGKDLNTYLLPARPCAEFTKSVHLFSSGTVQAFAATRRPCLSSRNTAGCLRTVTS